LLLLVAVALATGVERHHHHHKKHHRGDALLEVAQKARHHTYKIEPCYPPPCPGYEYDLTETITQAPAATTAAGNSQAGGSNGGGGGTVGGGGNGGGAGGSTTGGNGGTNSATNTPGSSDTTGTNLGGPTPLAPDPTTTDTPTATATVVVVAGSSGAAGAGGSAAFGPSSSSGPGIWVQIVNPPPDPKASETDMEASGCCNPTLAADRAKMADLQKQIDAQTEVRAGHIKWMQDAQDAMAKVQRQIGATNETIFELSQDINLLEQQIEQIQKKIRADILQQNLQAAQDQLTQIQQNADSIATQKDSVQSKADALVQKQNGILAQLNAIPHQNIELVAEQNDPTQQS